MSFLILIPVIFLSYQFCLQGRSDAILYSRRGDLAFAWNEHRIFVKERIVWGALIVSGFILSFSYYESQDPMYPALDLFALLAYSALGYSFWHNGVYGITKGKIYKMNKSPLTLFMYVSREDTAKYKYDFASRLYMLLFSFLFLAVNIIYKLVN